MKHKIFKTLLAAVVATMTFCAAANTVTVHGIDWNYSVKNGKASVGSGYRAPAIPKLTFGIIIIPSTLGGYPVTSIGEGAFSGCSLLMSVKIPNSVTSIGDYAFKDCSSLERVKIPDSVTSIGKEAFYRCSSLTSVTIPNSVTSIGRSAFSVCSSLKSVTIPNSVTSIGKDAFIGCGELTFYTDNGNRKRLRRMLRFSGANIKEIIAQDGDGLGWIVFPCGLVFVVGAAIFWIVQRKKKKEGICNKADCSVEVANVCDTVEELNENVCPSKGKWWSPSGRATRSKWWISRLVLVFSLILGVIALSSIRESYFENMLFIFSFIIICITVYMSIIVDIMRLHDMNLSGWTLLFVYFLQLMLLLVQYLVYISFLVLIVDLYFLIVFGFLDGTRGPNRYGEDPKDRV